MGAAGWMAFGQTEIRLIATIRVDHATKDGAQIPSPVGATIFAHPFRMRAKASPKRVSLPPLRGRVAPEGGRERGATVQNEAVALMKAACRPKAGFPSPDPA